MKFFKILFAIIFVAGVAFMLTTLALASEHGRKFTEEITSWNPAKQSKELAGDEELPKSDDTQIELTDNVILIK